jgi:F420-dependent oxidoreductase-like protein
MRFVLMTEPQQGLTYEEQLAVARRAAAAGFEAFFRSDHYESFPGEDDNPTTDAWTVLAGLARETERIGLGVLVSPVGYRRPGHLAKVVTTVDHMSGGRIELGLGAGWHDAEHRRHGLPFPPIRERGDDLEEQLQVLRGLLAEPDGWSFHGRHWTVEDARLRPRAVETPDRPRSDAGIARPRIIVGGGGKPRSLRLAARYADEFNITSADPQTVADAYRRLDEACEAEGRDPATVARSAMVGVLLGRDGDEVARREADLLAAFGTEDGGEAWLAERRNRWIHGTPNQARETIGRFADVGVERLMLQDFLARDLEMIDLMGEELIGRV